VKREERRALLARFRVDHGGAFCLSDHPPAQKGGLSKKEGVALLAARRKRLAELQERLYAEHRRAVLVVLQGMDTSGKDGVARQVFSGIAPQGVVATAFKRPSETELEHDFLWRIHQAVPSRGRIGIFNRSHYEDVMVLRVHPRQVRRADVQGNPDTPAFWDGRYEDIRNFESYLARQNIVTVKMLLHISAEEQRKRLLARLERPEKRWKFEASDLGERGFWDRYQTVFEEAIAATAQPEAPWYVVPSDHKWFARLVVLEAVIHHLEGMDPHPPEPTPETMAHLKEAMTALRAGSAP